MPALTCPQCHHGWDEAIDADQSVVQCPECFTVVSLAAALIPLSATTARPRPESAPSEPPFPVSEHEDAAFAETVAMPAALGGAPRRLGSADDETQRLVGRTVGGFRLTRLLGVGGMGTVFCARQISLDRDVALKILPDRFAHNAELLARFTREALSAAQLSHHNIVQVHDVGSDGGRHFISMEYVSGENLGEIVRRDGRLRIDDAASHALQAARGLEFAHDHNVVHRDIKPDNLILSDLGVVKIADMGLAKMVGDLPERGPRQPDEAELRRARGDLTMANRGMGTPAYMPPEQARDARSVDARADQYSLGCTLYYLCAGKPPYSGTTAFELISKHLHEPFTPLEERLPTVPPVFGAIVNRMLEKDPEDRYPDMGEAIRDLEAFLDIDGQQGPYTPREVHANALEAACQEFYATPVAKWRKLCVSGFAMGAPALVLWALFARQFILAGGLLGLLSLTLVLNFVFDGVMTRAYLFRRVRALFFGMSLRGWLKTVGAGALGLGALYVAGWLWAWAGFAIVGAGLAALYQWLVAGRLRRERRKPVEDMRAVLRQLRLRGVSEEALQDFVCRFSGVDWEEFFEALFGYEAMTAARGHWGGSDEVKARRKFATWRDPIAHWLDAIEESRREARDRRQLARVEAQRLRQAGASAREAWRAAELEASRFVGEELRARKRAARAAREARAERLRQAKRIRKRARKRWRRHMLRAGMGWPIQAVCALAGLAILAAWGGVYVQKTGAELPSQLVPLLGQYETWGAGGAREGLLAGGALLLMVFSGRPVLSLLVCVGAALVVGHVPIVAFAQQPLFTDAVALTAGAVVVLGGAGLALLDKLAGGSP